MATMRFLLHTFSLLLLSAAAVSARPGLPFHPCNTLLVSSFSFSLPSDNPIANPNPNFRHRPRFFAVVAEFRHLPRSRPFRGEFGPDLSLRKEEFDSDRNEFDFPELPLGFSSLKDRTKDILSVVASLLFGAACGAVTAATMYLIWSVFYYRQHRDAYSGLDGFSSDDGGDDGGDDDDDEDIFNPKKKNNGYVAIPAAPAAVAPVKESA